MNDDLQGLVDLHTELSINTDQGAFGHVWAGKSTIVNDFKKKHPAKPDNEAYTKRIEEVVSGIPPLIEGSLLIYLFALWESYTPDDIHQYMDNDDVLKFKAFQHVRDSVAHKVNGDRADFPARKKAFENCYPFSNIVWDQSSDRIDISGSSVARDFRDFVQSVIGRLMNHQRFNTQIS